MNAISTTFAATSVDDPQAGWGKLIALVAAAAAFWAFTEAHKRWKTTRPTPSPTDAGDKQVGANPQVKAIGDTDGTTAEKGPKELDVFVGQQVGKARTTDIVAQAQRRFRVSKRTALRAVTRAKTGGAQ